MPVDKSTRKARHEQAPNPVLRRKGFPSPAEGSDGESTFREIKGSVKQLVKKGSKWKEVS